VPRFFFASDGDRLSEVGVIPVLCPAFASAMLQCASSMENVPERERQRVMQKPATLFMVIGSVSAFLSVAAGAFGAHALKAILEPSRLAVYETAAKYQMYHAFALLIVAWQIHETSDPRLTQAGWLFCSGIVLFSGSLYVVALTDLTWAGAMTPLGGVAFLSGWAILAWTGWRRFKEV
jgi:uncharacterized membrane protein YgdD (TMEM256/DUF423 family)